MRNLSKTETGLFCSLVSESSCMELMVGFVNEYLICTEFILNMAIFVIL